MTSITFAAVICDADDPCSVNTAHDRNGVKSRSCPPSTTQKQEQFYQHTVFGLLLHWKQRSSLRQKVWSWSVGRCQAALQNHAPWRRTMPSRRQLRKPLQTLHLALIDTRQVHGRDAELVCGKALATSARWCEQTRHFRQLRFVLKIWRDGTSDGELSCNAVNRREMITVDMNHKYPQNWTRLQLHIRTPPKFNMHWNRRFENTNTWVGARVMAGKSGISKMNRNSNWSAKHNAQTTRNATSPR